MEKIKYRRERREGKRNGEKLFCVSVEIEELSDVSKEMMGNGGKKLVFVWRKKTREKQGR